ncbi:predicted protein [Sclerotinia sclerotiorum 1980 UF-70]|uniref:Uncharacterized protein n=1 Tax=Sclerotinia sclerotiorum (strain ATCC 18683 / 1980 / Ss-1) TaxID=665079 RepID=A7EHF7_SCLS1|nr:predicted protein [Sclerotinia sclerotiorum 1980 UF-70]EDO02273.1 predicted protein [Sclerotinia sclerotiorum 1980 UF-70]
MHCHSMEMEMEMANSYWVSQVRFFIALLSHLAQGYDKKIYEKVANEKSVVHWGFAPPMFHNEMMSSQIPSTVLDRSVRIESKFKRHMHLSRQHYGDLVVPENAMYLGAVRKGQYTPPSSGHCTKQTLKMSEMNTTRSIMELITTMSTDSMAT